MSHVGSRRSVIAAVVLAMLAGSAVSLAADGAGHDEHCAGCVGGLPFFDIRLDPVEHATDPVRDSLAAYRSSDAWQRRANAISRLSAGIVGLRVDEDVRLGTPQFIRSPYQLLTGPSQERPRRVVMAFADAYADLVEVNGAALDSYPVTREFETAGGLMNHLTWQQRIDGADLFGCELRASVTGDGRLINVASTIIAEPADGWTLPPRAIDEVGAIRAAAANIGVTLTADPLPTPQIGAHGGAIWEQTIDLGNQDPIETHAVYFARTRDVVVPAWWVSVPERGVGNTYDMVVDATDGTVLWRQNRLVWETTQPATYRVYTSDSPSPGSPGRSTPDGVQYPFVARTLLTIQPAEISAYSPNGWIPDGQTTTVGNNVDAYNDAANDNTVAPSDRATGVSRVFDFQMNVGLNTGDAPPTYRNASITQLFYYANRFHDRLYAMGFNEAARNFQTNNFGRGGTANDAVLVESQDGSGTNNANFSTTGVDGSTARCQMYIFTGPNPDRDGSFDGDIVYHEMAHGLSIRLHGGLSGTQAGGMGEGWSDYFGICLNAQPGDDLAGVYAASGYVAYNVVPGFTNNYYFGIRRFPYSPDLSKNPLTFADIDNGQYAVGSEPMSPFNAGQPANEVHNVGEVWCNVLLEARREVGLVEGSAANDIMMQLVVDGMKLAPPSPDFLDERDTILQADLVRYGGVHQSSIWRAFAKRGMGESATSPNGGSTVGVVESFDHPEAVIFTYPTGAPIMLPPSEPTTFQVTLTPRFLTIHPGTATISYSAAGGEYITAPLQLVSGSTYAATLPGFPCFTGVSYYISVDTSAGVQSDPEGGAASPRAAQVFTSEPLALADDMEMDLGWVSGQPGDTATAGQWQRGDPQPNAAQPGDDHTPDPGVNCWITGLTAGPTIGSFDVDSGYTTLLSPLFDVAGQPDAVISYWRWYFNASGAAPFADTFRVEISNDNGATWTAFETVGPTGVGTSGGWYRAARRVGDVIVPTSQMRMRFIADDAGTGSVVEAAIDDFLVTLPRLCQPTICIADFNQDGGIDGTDVDAFFGAWEGGDASADVNHDGGVDGTDVSTFFGAWEAGGCG